jgi:hypothetical protein
MQNGSIIGKQKLAIVVSIKGMAIGPQQNLS